MELLSATPSPYARKVRSALAQKNLAFELFTEVAWNRGASAGEYNPLEKIPVSISADGSTVYESRCMLEWLEIRYPQSALFPRDSDQLLAPRPLEGSADGVGDASVRAAFERRRPEDKRSQAWLEPVAPA